MFAEMLVSWCDCLDSQVAHPRLWAQGASLCVWFFWILVSVVFGCGCWGFCFIGFSCYSCSFSFSVTFCIMLAVVLCAVSVSS